MVDNVTYSLRVVQGDFVCFYFYLTEEDILLVFVKLHPFLQILQKFNNEI